MRAFGADGLLSGWRGVVALAALTLAGLAAGGAAQGSSSSGLLKVRLGGDATETRVVLDLDRSVSGKVLSDGADGKVVLTLPRVGVSSAMKGPGQGLVRAWSVERAAGAAKVNIELTRDAEISRRFLLPPAEGVPHYRYVVDLKATGAATTPSRRATPPKATPVRAPLKRGPYVIVIDAGHGGKDPGALGSRSKEKDITLAAARALKARLEKSGRYQVVLTRSSDIYIPPQDRAPIARRAGADLFISLHADSGPNGDTRGASVYTLSEKGESRVASVLTKNDWLLPASLPGADRTVGEIILDLTQRSTRNRSSMFASLLLDHIEDETVLLRRSHRDANLVVLLAPDVPAVLLEMGFINNADDETALNDSRRRARLMDAIGDAVDAWFAREAKSSRS